MSFTDADAQNFENYKIMFADDPSVKDLDYFKSNKDENQPSAKRIAIASPPEPKKWKIKYGLDTEESKRISATVFNQVV